MPLGKMPSATVEVVFIIGLGGEQCKWGMQTVRKGKSLVQLKKVQNSSAKPSFAFAPNWQERNMSVKAWNKISLTLQKVLEELDDPVILVLMRKLSLPASAICFQRDANGVKLELRLEPRAKKKSIRLLTKKKTIHLLLQQPPPMTRTHVKKV
jgi:hypothetical protein